MQAQPVYPNLRVIRGGVCTPSKGVSAKRNIERELSGLVAIACASVAATVPAHERDWVYDLRKGKRSVCGGLFRFIDFLHRRGWPIETALLIPEWIRGYVLELYGQAPTSTPAAQWKRAA